MLIRVPSFAEVTFGGKATERRTLKDGKTCFVVAAEVLDFALVYWPRNAPSRHVRSRLTSWCAGSKTRTKLPVQAFVLGCCSETPHPEVRDSS